MTQHSHQTAPTRFVEGNGIRFAYCRFGRSGGVPLVFNMHFTGTMDHWDPAVPTASPRIARSSCSTMQVSSSSGEVPTSIEEMAANAAAFIKALGLARVVVLGFSIGGFIAQMMAIAEPKLVRRVVLVGTGPRGGEGMATLTPEAQEIFGATYKEPDRLWLLVHFTPSERSQAAGREFLKRFRLRSQSRDPEVSDKVAPAQLAAIEKWGAPRENPYEYVKKLNQVQDERVHRVDDHIGAAVHDEGRLRPSRTRSSFSTRTPNHGSQYQYPDLFVRHVSMFPEEQGRAA